MHTQSPLNFGTHRHRDVGVWCWDFICRTRLKTEFSREREFVLGVFNKDGKLKVMDVPKNLFTRKWLEILSSTVWVFKIPENDFSNSKDFLRYEIKKLKFSNLQCFQSSLKADSGSDEASSLLHIISAFKSSMILCLFGRLDQNGSFKPLNLRMPRYWPDNDHRLAQPDAELADESPEQKPKVSISFSSISF